MKGAIYYMKKQILLDKATFDSQRLYIYLEIINHLPLIIMSYGNELYCY